MKLLICEDDISTINLLKNKLDLKSFGINEVLEAYNGALAKDIIKEKNPELILCDIGMPKVNGVEVLKFLRKINENTEFVFLTCYEDFEYAQAAIEYNATGYITKPFKLKQVETMLYKMVENYRKKTENGKNNQIKEDLLCTSVFKQVADGLYGTNKELIGNYLKDSGMEIDINSKFQIVFTSMNIFNTKNSEWTKENLLYTASRIHDEILNEYLGSAHVIMDVDDRFLWCLSFVKGDVSKRTLEKRCESLNNFFYEYYSIKPVMLISDVFEFYKTADVVCDLYEKIRKIRFYEGKIFHISDSIDIPENIIKFDGYQMLWYLRNRDESGYTEYINNILKLVEKQDSYKQFKEEIMMFYLTVMKDNKMSSSLITNNEKLNKLDKQTLNKKMLLQYAQELMSIYEKETMSVNDSENIVLRAKRFIDENYRDDIDRDNVAEVAFVTPNYLSKLFRNSMGMNLREYINQLRIDEAKRLLLSTNMTISEIAIYVGYYNISYFSTIFHKLVGTSPAEWRERGIEAE